MSNDLGRGAWKQSAALAVALIFAATSAFAAEREWPSFRGGHRMGIASTKGVPIAWSPTENVLWKTPLPGPGASSPVQFNDRIYLTYFTGYLASEDDTGSPEKLERHLVALDRDTGRTIWDRAVPAKLPEEERIRDHGFAASTPAVDVERIIVFFGKSGVLAFDHAGNQLWQTDVGSKTHGWGSAASPVLDGELVYINASVESESLIALDCRTGAEKWRAGDIKDSWNTPILVSTPQRRELVVARQGSIAAFDPKTGKPLWTCKTDITWYMVPTMVESDGVIYCLGGRSGIASLAVRAGGEGDVTETHRLWKTTKGSNVSSPVFRDGHLYWVQDSLGVAYCAKAETGELVYEQRLERPGQIYASALLADDRLYYLTRTGRMFVLAAKPEFEQLAVNDLGDRSIFNGSPAVDGSRLLIRSDKFLYCVGK